MVRFLKFLLTRIFPAFLVLGLFIAGFIYLQRTKPVVEPITLEEKEWSVKGLEKKFDLVLIDAPCSGIGKWSRSPDSKFSFSKKKLEELVIIQYDLLLKGSLMVKPGGKLAYMVCSFLYEEGLNQIEKFKKKNNLDFSEINMVNMWNDTIYLMNKTPYPFNNGENSLLLNTPSHKTDGFFISMFQRKR